MINWSQQALSLIRAAPPHVQSIIQHQVTLVASQRSLDLVTPDLVIAMLAEQPHEPLNPPCVLNDELDMSPYYANETGEPLLSAFEPTHDVHVFAGGEMITSGQAAEAWAREEAVTSPPGRSTCLYIHIPFCRARCVFCPFYANRWTPDACSVYVHALVREIELLGDTPLGQTPLEAVYFGGGTPSDLGPDGLSKVLSTINKHLVLAEHAEITLEGRVWGQDRDVVQAALDGGVNRFSIGVQSFDTHLRQSLGRKASRDEVVAFLNGLANSPAAVVIDLIFGLPGQAMSSWLEDLRCLHEDTGVHGVDLYRLKVVPGSKIEEMIAGNRLPRTTDLLTTDLSTTAGMFAAGVEAMERVGWERLSISHWRRDCREQSRYNTLVKSGADCIPIGCGAGGRVGDTRFFQTGSLGSYMSTIEEGRKPIASAAQLGEHSHVVDRIAAELEQGRLAPAAWAPDGDPTARAFETVLSQWSRARLLSRRDDEYDLTVAGQFWSVQMGARLARLVQASEARVRYSRENLQLNSTDDPVHGDRHA